MKKSQLQELIRELFQQMLEEDDTIKRGKATDGFGSGFDDSSTPTDKTIGY